MRLVGILDYDVVCYCHKNEVGTCFEVYKQVLNDQFHYLVDQPNILLFETKITP